MSKSRLGNTAINNRCTCGTVSPLTVFLIAAADAPRKNGPADTGPYDDAILVNWARHNRQCPDIVCSAQGTSHFAIASRSGEARGEVRYETPLCRSTSRVAPDR